MSLLCDWQIRELAYEQNMIDPFFEGPLPPGTISYGLGSYGYDVRLGRKFKIFTNVYGPVVDVKNFDPRSFVDYEGDFCVMPPHSFVLAESVEYFRIPRDITCLVTGKSTYARAGVILNMTPLEAEWQGIVTLEISNTAPLPARLYAGEGIGQVLFLRGEKVCSRSYADKKGVYQDQMGLTLPRVRQRSEEEVC
jgi:dCTP deaminase